jgi:hypothetical protein
MGRVGGQLEAMLTIKCHVYPRLLERLDPASSTDAGKLLENLLRLARPFPLLKLPDDLQSRVFDQIPYEICSLTRVCNEIRQLTLPTYFAHTTVALRALTPYITAEEMQAWAQKIPGSYHTTATTRELQSTLSQPHRRSRHCLRERHRHHGHLRIE